MTKKMIMWFYKLADISDLTTIFFNQQFSIIILKTICETNFKKNITQFFNNNFDKKKYMSILIKIMCVIRIHAMDDFL